MTTPDQQPRVTLLVQLLVLMLAATLGMAVDVLWTDLLHSNPHRSVRHALAMIPVLGPGAGILLVAQRHGAALLLMAVLGTAWRRRWGTAPLASLLALLPLGIALSQLQGILLTYHAYAGLAADATSGLALLLADLGILLPAYVAAWISLRRPG